MNDSFQHLHLLGHPFYQDWMQGTLSLDTIREYSKQYSFHVDSFPRYLSAIHSFCENPEARKHLLENLNDEEGFTYGTSHPDLWRQFAEGLGVSRAELGSAPRSAAIEHVIQTFFKHARKSYAAGLGALYAYESQIPEIAESKIAGLIKNYKIDDAKTLSFFEVHRHADIEHRQVIENLLAQLSEPKQLEAKQAALEAAQSLWDFLTAMHTPRVACA
jgi:pyrroloquinoline-quinone synthase